MFFFLQFLIKEFFFLFIYKTTSLTYTLPDFPHYVYRGIRQVPLRLLRQALRRQQIHPKRPTLMDSWSDIKRDIK